MSGSGYAIGLAIASYEWMAAITLILVGKYLLPVFLRAEIYTMPQFLQQRYDHRVRLVMAFFWLGVYVLVNLTSVLWLGALAINTVAGIDLNIALLLLGVFAAGYSLYGGLKAVALTDIIQVVLLVLGGLLIAWILLNKVSDGAGVLTGFGLLMEEHQKIRHDSQCRQSTLHEPAWAFGSDRRHVGHERFLLGFQSVHYSACAGGKEHRRSAKRHRFRRIPEALDAGDRRVAGHCCFCSRRRNQRAGSSLSARYDPAACWYKRAGVCGAAGGYRVVPSLYDEQYFDYFHHGHLPSFNKGGIADPVRVGRIVALAAMLIAMMTARPLLGNFDQAFQYIQNSLDSLHPALW